MKQPRPKQQERVALIVSFCVFFLASVSAAVPQEAASLSDSRWWHGKHSLETLDQQELSWASSSAGSILLNGKPFHIKGVNWNGLEYIRPVLGGLENTSMSFLLDTLKRNGFNAVRMPLSLVIINYIYYPEYGKDRAYVDEELLGKGVWPVLDCVMAELGKRGILVLFDLHMLDPQTGFDELWYNSAFSEYQVVRGWAQVVARYKTAYNFLGIDLKNEPHGSASWGTASPSTDFNSFAERAITAIGHEHPDFKGLFGVEGVAGNVDADPSDRSPFKYWWGEDFEGVIKHPVCTGSADLDARIVYSPRVYGPDVYDMEYFSDPAFPDNLEEVWDSQLIWLERRTGHAAIMGEWGGTLTGKDRAVQWRLASWMAKSCIDDNLFWALNPGSGVDIPEGLINSDYTTLDHERLALTAFVQPDPSRILYTWTPAGPVLKLYRGSPRYPECAITPSHHPRPTPPPSAPPNSYRPDPFAGLPPGTTSQELSVRRRYRVRPWAAGYSSTSDVDKKSSDGSHVRRAV